MTKIFTASDLHVDFQVDQGEMLIDSFPAADIGVFAGDLCQWNLLEETLARLCDHFDEIIYVSGNHEYYGSDWMNVENIIRNCVSKLGNLTWLNDDRVSIGGVNFIGNTLWFPDSPAAQAHKMFLNDYRMIGGFEPEVYRRHKATLDFFFDPDQGIQPGDVVVTHHSPSHSSIHPRFANSAINCYFSNDLDYVIEAQKPAMWIHGHTHDPFDYIIGSTRIICNPHGYPHERNGGCDRGLVLEV